MPNISFPALEELEADKDQEEEEVPPPPADHVPRGKGDDKDGDDSDDGADAGGAGTGGTGGVCLLPRDDRVIPQAVSAS